LTYLTFLSAGKPNPEEPNLSLYSVVAMAADAEGNAYVAGTASDTGYPSAPFVAFALKLDPTGSAIVWTNLPTGTGPSRVQAIAIDPAGDVWVSGTTQTANFVNATGWPNGNDEFLAEIDPSVATLAYSALLPVNTVAAALAVDPSGTVHAAGANGLVSAFREGSAPGQTSAPWMFGFANAARGNLTGRLAPGELISLYGLNLGPATPVVATFDAAGFLPATLGGVQVTIGGIAAPLLFVSPAQVNLVVPVELSAGSPANLQVTLNNTPLSVFRAVTDSAAPQVFQDSYGAVAINQDGTLNSPSNPAPNGSYVSIWATGTGYFQGNDGQMQTGANTYCASIGECQILAQSTPFTATPVNATYIGAAPGTVNGVVQINFQVTGGYNTYYFSVNGINSDLFGISVAQ